MEDIYSASHNPFSSAFLWIRIWLKIFTFPAAAASHELPCAAALCDCVAHWLTFIVSPHPSLYTNCPLMSLNRTSHSTKYRVSWQRHKNEYRLGTHCVTAGKSKMLKGDHCLQMKWKMLLLWSSFVAKVNRKVFNHLEDKKRNAVQHSCRKMSAVKHSYSSSEES